MGNDVCNHVCNRLILGMIYIFQLYVLIWTAVSAFRDGKAERLRSTTSGLPEVIAWLNSLWHASGGWLYVISCSPFIAMAIQHQIDWYFPPIYAVLFRAMVFNPIRNKSANEDTWYIGNSSKLDRYCRKKFGVDGSWKISIIMAILIIISNILHARLYS